MNISEKLLLLMISGLVGGQIGQAVYPRDLIFPIITLLGMAYCFNVHGIIWHKFKEMKNV